MVEPEYSEFHNVLNLKVVWATWPEKGVLNGIIFLVHGILSHSGLTWLHKPLDKRPPPEVGFVPLYEGSWIQKFNDDGYRTVAMDLQGHGRSEGWRGTRANVEFFEDYVDDLARLVREYRQNHPRTPFHIIGSSVGGAIIIRMIERQYEGVPDFQNVVLLSPATDIIKPWWYDVARPAISVISKMSPNLKVRKGDRPVTPDERLNEWIVNDPYFPGGALSARLVSELNNAVRAVHRDVGCIGRNIKRIVIFHNFFDDVTNVDGSMKFIEALRRNRPRIKDELMIINGHRGLPREYMRRPKVANLNVFHILADVEEIYDEIKTLL